MGCFCACFTAFEHVAIAMVCASSKVWVAKRRRFAVIHYDTLGGYGFGISGPELHYYIAR
jgi:hypothetical protein